MVKKNPPGNTAFSSFILHLHPRTIPAETIRFYLSFGLGGIAASLVFVLFITGLLQLLSYSSETVSAYQSIRQMYIAGGIAGFIRNIHYWSGNLLVIIAFLHLLRVFLTGALADGREYNWLVGTGLFILVLLANFTGYLMPWDQLAYWAVTIFTSMVSYVPFVGEWLMGLLRGGSDVGPATLSNFFAIHVGIIPAGMILLIVWHFWLVRKAGGLVQECDLGTIRKKRISTIPHLIQREAAVGLGLLALLLLFSALFDAPLGDEANPGQSPNPTKAAWYFMGLQELLLHLHPVFAICVVPIGMIAAFMVIPFFKDTVLKGGIWFGGEKGRRIAFLLFLTGFLVNILGIVADEIIRNSAASHSTLVERGILPVCGYILLICGVYYLLKKKGRCLRAEAVMGVVMFVCGGVIGLTVVGIWFRGPEMILMIPL